MQLDKIPLELKQLRQWVVWRPVIKKLPDGTEKVTKPPFRASDPARQADTTDAQSWGTFDEAVAAWHQYSSVVSGVGFVFTRDDPYFGIDVDTEAKVKPEHLEKRRMFVRNLLARADTYTETSPSGDGLHIIGRGQMPLAGKQANDVGAEMYGWDRFFTMTGDVIAENKAHITDQQAFLEELGFRPGMDVQQTVGDAPANRSMDLSDEDVVRLASNGSPTFAPRYNAISDVGPGQWSNSFTAVVGALDRITGSVEQIERIVYASPMVCRCAPAAGGETRPHKARREFHNVLAFVRGQNNGGFSSAEHGRQIMANIEAAKLERAKVAEEALRQAEAAVGKLSSGSAKLLDAFPQLSHEHKVLTCPPGVMGEFVLATERACYNPFTKFAIPATFAALSGILARGYKLPGGSGLNLNFVLAAPTSAGKTQTMDAWVDFQNAAAAGMPATPGGPARARIITASTSSIQAMMPVFATTPSVGWFVDECYSLLKTMSDGKTNVDSALRDNFNLMYGCSKHNAMFSGPLSVAGRKAEQTPINNLSVSTYWITVTSNLDKVLSTSDAMDGYLSRVIIVRHDDIGGPDSYDQQAMPEHLLQALRDRMAAATYLDEAYATGRDPDKLLTIVSTDGVEVLRRQLAETCRAISNAAIQKTLPLDYTAVSRLHVTAMRMAAVMAVMDSPYAPAVTQQQLKWCFGYLLQNMVSILSDMDTGEMGAKANDDVSTVVRTIKQMLVLKGTKESYPGVYKRDLVNKLRERKPFSSPGPHTSSTKMVSECLALMEKEKYLEPVDVPTGTRGRGRVYLVPQDLDSFPWV